VVYLSKTELGKKHDKKVADEAQIAYPLNATLGKDTGFQGYEPPDVIAWQPKKKPKGQDLSVADLFVNELLSSVRIVVEHSLSGVKRCRIVKDVLRNTKAGFSDLVMEVACALHNLRVEFRHPVPTFDIRATFAYSE
jgi:DDE superfamily endonuclease